MDNRKHGVIWIKQAAWTDVLAEGARKHPLETGGILIGYYTEGASDVVVTHAVGPGPKAVHKRYYFRPDGVWQQSEMARIYHDSRGVNTYIGEWHTHPYGTTRLSKLDRRTLHVIAQCPGARAAEPKMLVLAGGPDSWSTDAVSLSRWRRLYGSRGLQSFNVKIYSDAS